MNYKKTRCFILLCILFNLIYSFCNESLINADNREIYNDEAIQEWKDKAQEWADYIGNEGEKSSNRVYQSDPVLWEMLGEINDLVILDVGCGEGYLSRKLTSKGAQVIAVDASDRLIAIAKERTAEESFKIDYRVEDCASMKSITSGSIDRIVCNYVLMDIISLDETIKEFYRVLKPTGKAILIFLHPCFPMESIRQAPELVIAYGWKHPYFQEHKMTLPRWGNFSKDFTIFHRPLSTYWQCFRRAGFEINDFQEPYLTEALQKQLDEKLVKKFTVMPIQLHFHSKKNNDLSWCEFYKRKIINANI